MATIEQIRASIPWAKDLSDDEIIGEVSLALGKPRDIVAEDLGAFKKTRNPLAVANDLAIEGANAALGGVKSAVDFVVPGTGMSKGIQRLIDSGEESQSYKTQRAKRELGESLQTSDFIPQAKGVGRYVLENPGLAAAQAAGSFAGPGLGIKAARGLAGMRNYATKEAAEQAAQRAGIGTGMGLSGAMSGGDAAGNAYDLVMNSKELAHLPEEERHDMAVKAARMGSVAPFLYGMATGAFGAEGAMARNASKGILRTAGTEALSEFGDEGLSQFSGRYAAKQFDPTIDSTEGVFGSAVLGGALGGITGAGTGYLTRPRPTATPDNKNDPFDLLNKPNGIPGSAAEAEAEWAARQPSLFQDSDLPPPFVGPRMPAPPGYQPDMFNPDPGVYAAAPMQFTASTRAPTAVVPPTAPAGQQAAAQQATDPIIALKAQVAPALAQAVPGISKQKQLVMLNRHVNEAGVTTPEEFVASLEEAANAAVNDWVTAESTTAKKGQPTKRLAEAQNLVNWLQVVKGQPPITVEQYLQQQASAASVAEAQAQAAEAERQRKLLVDTTATQGQVTADDPRRNRGQSVREQLAEQPRPEFELAPMEDPKYIHGAPAPEQLGPQVVQKQQRELSRQMDLPFTEERRIPLKRGEQGTLDLEGGFAPYPQQPGAAPVEEDVPSGKAPKGPKQLELGNRRGRWAAPAQKKAKPAEEAPATAPVAKPTEQEAAANRTDFAKSYAPVSDVISDEELAAYLDYSDKLEAEQGTDLDTDEEIRGSLTTNESAASLRSTDDEDDAVQFQSGASMRVRGKGEGNDLWRPVDPKTGKRKVEAAKNRGENIIGDVSQKDYSGTAGDAAYRKAKGDITKVSDADVNNLMEAALLRKDTAFANALVAELTRRERKRIAANNKRGESTSVETVDEEDAQENDDAPAAELFDSPEGAKPVAEEPVEEDAPKKDKKTKVDPRSFEERLAEARKKNAEKKAKEKKDAEAAQAAKPAAPEGAVKAEAPAAPAEDAKPAARELVKGDDPLAKVPPMFVQQHTVTVQAVDKDGKYVPYPFPADKAIAGIKQDIAAFKALLKCVKGGR